MTSVYLNYNNFIVLIRVFIHSFNKHWLSAHWVPLSSSLFCEDYRGEYDEIPIDTEIIIQRDKKND